ncbi:MAG: hypothetical protein ACPL6C_03485, partial [bacterium]
MNKFSAMMMVLFIAMWGCGQKKTTGNNRIVKQEEIIPVKICTPGYNTIEKRITFTGTAEGIDDAIVFSDLPGRFIKYLKPEGSFVRKGESIAMLEREVPGLEFKPVLVNAPIDGYLSYMSLSSGQVVL